MGLSLELNNQEEFQQEEGGNHVGEEGDLLGLAGKDLDDGVGDEAQADGVADGAGNRHPDEHQGDGDHLVQVVKLHVLEAHEHQHTHIDEGGGGGGGGDDGRNGGDEDAGQEEDAGGEGGKAGAAACLHAGGGFHEGGDGGGAGAGPRHGAQGVGEKGFLHLGHVAVLVHHPGAGGGAHQGTDGVKHVNHAEGDDEGDGGEPTHLEEALEVELEEGGGHHVAEGGNKGGGCQGGEGVLSQHGGPRPVNHRGNEHPRQNGALDALLRQDDNGKEADKHGGHLEHHGGVPGAHGGLGHAGGEGPEEIPHHKEGTAGLGIDAGVGAKADVHQHQADGGGDAQTNPQGDGVHNLLPDVEDGEDDEDDALHQDNHQGGLEAVHIAHAGEGGNVGYHNGKKAVEAHAGSQSKGLVGQEGHAEHGKGGGQAGGQKNAVPQGGAHIKAGEQVGVQGDDVSHRHEGG